MIFSHIHAIIKLLMGTPEKPGKELVPTGLDGELCARFNATLQNAADHLELFTKPDELTVTIKQMAFGITGEEALHLSHTDDNGFHSGTITYRYRGADPYENSKRSFNFTHTTRDLHSWQNGERNFSTNFVLHKLLRNWPLYINHDKLDELIERTRPLTDDLPPRPIPVEEVFALLEEYALAQQTGDVEYDRQWNYFEVSPGANDNNHTVSQLLSIAVLRDDELLNIRQVRASITLSYEVDGAAVPLTLHVHSDELENILVTASYPSPLTGAQKVVSIKDYAACHTQLDFLVAALVAEKTAFSKQ